MRKAKGYFFLILLIGWGWTPARAALVNGDFSSGLSGWTALGATQSAGGTASLADGVGGAGSVLNQVVALAPGDYQFSFDFQNQLSSQVPTGTFPDSFFATLYFANSAAGFNVNNAAAATSVLQLDHAGAGSFQGTLSASALGANWTHLSFLFTNSFADVIPYFELIDSNFIDSDSTVLIDNVQLSAVQPVVPEPPSLALVGLGSMLIAMLAARRRGILAPSARGR